jgi:hypothetical protein
MATRFVLAALLLAAAAWLSLGPVPNVVPRAPWPPNLSAEAVQLWQRALGLTARNQAPALIVSRFQFEHLKPLRSWQDLERLRAYVEWADRAENVGFDGIEVDADASTSDLILLRLPRTTILARGGTAMRDPIGFTVLSVARDGRQRIPSAEMISQVPFPTLAPNLTTRTLPIIRAAVARSSTIVELYGEGFNGTAIRAFSNGGPARVVYAGANQINVVVSARDRVAVEIDGLRSDWCEVRR